MNDVSNVNERNDNFAVSTAALAEMLDVSESWLKKNRKDKDGIPYFKLGKKIYYEKKDVFAWIKENKKQMARLRQDDK